MYLARVIGRVVATRQYEGLSGVALQWIQPLDENGAAMGDALVACAVVSTGPGDLVHFVDGREGALACPEPFVPVDAAIIGFVEQAVSSGRFIGREDEPRAATPARDDRARPDARTRAPSSEAAPSASSKVSPAASGASSPTAERR